MLRAFASIQLSSTEQSASDHARTEHDIESLLQLVRDLQSLVQYQVEEPHYHRKHHGSVIPPKSLHHPSTHIAA